MEEITFTHPLSLDFYGMGVLKNETLEICPPLPVDCWQYPLYRGIALQLHMESEWLFVLVFDKHQDASMSAEMANVLASRLLGDFGRLGPPRRLGPSALKRLGPHLESGTRTDFVWETPEGRALPLAVYLKNISRRSGRA